MDRNLTMGAVRLTEAAALLASRHMGKGDDEIAHLSAAEALFKVLSGMDINGIVINGADSSDSPICDGSPVGTKNGPDADIAVKPLDGKRTCARGGYNAISIIAIGSKGSFLKSPSLLMEKIAVGSESKGVIDINQPVDINIKRIARAKGKYIEDITVCVLDREVNQDLVALIRKTGAKIKYLRDGDISGAIATGMPNNNIDVLMGIGGAKEGVLAASALRCLDGDMQTKFVTSNKKERELMEEHGLDLDRVYSINDLVKNQEVMVSCTGITDGVILPGVRYFSGGAETSSVLFRQKTRTLRMINAIHHFDHKPIY